MNESIIDVPQTRRPPVDMIGTYTLVEPTQKAGKDGVSYDIPAGDYPVMALFSEDGKQVKASATIFSAPDPNTGKRLDVHEFHRILEIPELVQRRLITLEQNVSLALFAPPPPEKKQSAAQEPERKLSIVR